MSKTHLTPEDLTLTVGEFRESGAMRRAIARGWGLDILELKALEGAYRETKNPVFALMAFKVARNKVPSQDIPEWVLDLIGDAIEAYLKPSNEKGFDSLLGLKPGRGHTPAVKGAWRDAYQHYLCREMAILRWIFRISIAHAADMVASRKVKSRQKQFTDLGIPRSVMRHYASTSLKELFEKRYYKRFLFLKTLTGPQYKFTDEEKRPLLRAYSPDSLPAKLRKILG